MTRTAGRIRFGLIAALLALLWLGQNAYGQFSVNVVASSGAPSPNPACVNEEITASLTATVTNPPMPTAYCPINGPFWSWSVDSVEYRALATNPWGPSPGGDSVMINHPSPSSANATLTAMFSQGGHWRITARANVSYNNFPCLDTWTGSGTTQVTVTVVSASFSPDPVYVCQGMTASLGVALTPADAGALPLTRPTPGLPPYRDPRPP